MIEKFRKSLLRLLRWEGDSSRTLPPNAMPGAGILILSPRQQTVHQLLKNRQTKERPLADYYLGSLYALENDNNPERLSQAAQSLRELLEKFPYILSSGDLLPSETDVSIKASDCAWWVKLRRSHQDKQTFLSLIPSKRAWPRPTRANASVGVMPTTEGAQINRNLVHPNFFC